MSGKRATPSSFQGHRTQMKKKPVTDTDEYLKARDNAQKIHSDKIQSLHGAVNAMKAAWFNDPLVITEKVKRM